MDYTPEQQQAIAMAQARKRQTEANTETPLTRLPTTGAAGIVKRLGSAAQMGFQGITGGLGEEVRAGMGALPLSALSAVVPNAKTVNPLEAYNMLYGMARNETEQSRENYPIQSAGAEIAGSIPTALTIGATKPAMALANWTSTGNAATKAAKAYATAVPATAAYLAADATGGISDRLAATSKAPLYALAAPALSVGASAIGGLISKGEQSIAKKVLEKEMVSGTGLSDVSDKAAKKVIDRLKADFPEPEEFDSAMKQFVYGKKSLAEIGGARTENLARGAAQFPSGEALSREFIEPKVAQAPENVTNAVKKFISNKYNYQDTVDDIVAKGRERAAPIYEQVKQANPSMASPRLDAILNRPAAKDALKTVAQDYQNKAALMAKPDPEMTSLAKELADLDMMAETKGGVSGGLKFSALDAIKKELDLKTRAAKRAMDMGNDNGNTYRALDDVRRALVDELDTLDKSGLYAKARAQAGDYITAEKAADMGTNFKNIDPQDLTRTMSKYSKSEKDAFRVGMVKQLRKDISLSARDPAMSNANIYNKILGNKWQKDQIEAAIGKPNFQALEKELESTKRIYQLKQSVLGNSTTANKQIAAQEFDSQGQDLINQAIQGGWKNIAADKVMNFVSRHFSGLSDKTAEDVAKILYATDPAEKVKIYNRLKLSNIPTEEKKRALKAAFTIEEKSGFGKVKQFAKDYIADESGALKIPSLTDKYYKTPSKHGDKLEDFLSQNKVEFSREKAGTGSEYFTIYKPDGGQITARIADHANQTAMSSKHSNNYQIYPDDGGMGGGSSVEKLINDLSEKYGFSYTAPKKIENSKITKADLIYRYGRNQANPSGTEQDVLQRINEDLKYSDSLFKDMYKMSKDEVKKIMGIK